MLSKILRIVPALARLALILLGSTVYFLATGVAPASAHQPHDPMTVVAVSPNFANDHTVFVGTGLLSVTQATSVLLKSTDGGLTYQVSPGIPNYQMSALSISPAYASDGTVFVGTNGGGLWISVNQGSSWTATSISGTVNAVALSPNYGTDHTVYAATGTGSAYRSTDGGSTWSQLTGLAAPASAFAISPNFAADQTVFAGTAGQGVFISSDGGNTWTSASQGLGSNANISALATSPNFTAAKRQAHAIVGQAKPHARNTARQSAKRHAAVNSKTHVASSPDQTLVTGTTGGGVYVSIDGGTTWSAADSGLTNKYITALVFSPNYGSDQTLFASTAIGLAFKSTNGTASWTATAPVPRPLSPQTSIHALGLAISPNFAADSTVFMPMFEGLYKTTNAGALWQYEETLPPWLVRSISISPAYNTDHTVIASNYGGGMLQTTDGGQTWHTQSQNVGLQVCSPNATAITPPYNGGSASFAATVYGLEKDSPAGTNWTMLSMLGVPTSLRATAVSPNYAKDQTVYMGTDYLGTPDPITTTYKGQVISTDGTFVSNDGGKNWAPTGINGMSVHSISISPNFAVDGTMYVSSLNQGVYKSTDRGVTFTVAPGPLGKAAADPVVVSPNYASDQTVFAAVPTGNASLRGLYRSTNGGTSWALLPNSKGFTILTLALSPNYAADHTLFVGTLERSLLVSTDGGNTFAPSGLTDPYVTAVAVSPAYTTDRTLYASTYQGLWESNDGAATWQPMPAKASFGDHEPGVARSGHWKTTAEPGADCGNVAASSSMSDTIQLSFSGTGVAWTGGKGPGYGTANVYVDGAFQQTVDLYAPSYAAQQTLYQNQALAPGTHTLMIVVTGQHDPLSVGSLVTLDNVVVTRSLP